MIYQKSKAKAIISSKKQITSIVNKTIEDMANIVSSTLGPGGRGVLIERDGQAPLVTKDGVTVAKSLGVGNAEANIVIEAAKEICLNTAKEAGDGTTTAIILADAIIKAGHDFLSKNPKYNPQKIVNELKIVYKEIICDYLKSRAITSLSKEDLLNVAKISANGDELIASSAVNAVIAAGDDGTVLIEESQGNETKVETIDGYIITSGLKELGQIGPVFINDRAGQQVSMDNGIVFLFDGAINNLKTLAYMQDALEGTDYYGSPILIFAHDYSDAVIDKIAKNVKSGFVIAPVKTPRAGIPNSRSMFLRDMAAYTGAQVFDPGNIERITTDDFGRFTSSKCNMYETFVIVDECSEKQTTLINQRVEELKAIADSCHSDYDKMFIKASIGRLTGGISTIWVGGESDLEIREKKGRVEDAVEAVRSAISEGIIPGGCSVQLDLADIIEQLDVEKYKASKEIMVKALRHPFSVLLENCGESVEEIYSEYVRLSKDAVRINNLPSMIFNADTHQFDNPFSCGVIEPAKVCRVSVGNALSVASLLMTLGGIVVVPRDSALETQLELSKQAFTDMMQSANQPD